jgi:glycosyltransferase involved in cell wall biosynthesis
MDRGVCAFVVPGPLERLSGGNLYDRVAIDALQARGWDVEVMDPGRSPSGADVVVVDSLAFPHGPPEADGPIVAVAHQLPSQAANRPEWAAPERELLLASRLVVTVSQWLRGELATLTDTWIEVVTPGRDLAAAPEGPAHGADLVLAVGNAVPGKGMPEAVEAFLRADLLGATLAVAGDLGWDRAETERLRAAAALDSGRVRLLGPIDPEDLAGLYRGARVFLSASTYEGWPIAVAEAMASGLPVVGYSGPGMTEVVGSDGLLVPSGDHAELTKALARVWNDPGMARGLGEKGLRRAQRWPTWTETGERFADLVEREVGITSGRPA